MDEKVMVNLLLQRDPAGMEALPRHYARYLSAEKGGAL